MSQLTYNPRKINEDDFPIAGSIADKLKFLLNYAVFAPFSHNAQPWRLEIDNDAIELYADKTRALPVADPNYRELTISCGAALFHLRIAIRHFGYGDIVEIFPEPNNPNLLARIRLGSKRIPQLEENFIFRAILKRSTNRLTFEDNRLSQSLLSELRSACCSEQSGQQICTQQVSVDKRDAVVNLIAEGDRLQMADPLFRRELAQWLHPANNLNRDGIPGYARGSNRRLDGLTPFISQAVRTLNLGKSQAAKDRKLAIQAPALILISSESDRPRDWLATGEALTHLLLRARVEDVLASFFNQPIQVPQLRSRLQNLFPESGYPQILLRLGYAQEVEPTPRRSVDEVVSWGRFMKRPYRSLNKEKYQNELA